MNIFSLVKIAVKKIKWRRADCLTDVPQWEEDYLLNSVNHYYLMEEYMEMSI